MMSAYSPPYKAPLASSLHSVMATAPARHHVSQPVTAPGPDPRRIEQLFPLLMRSHPIPMFFAIPTARAGPDCCCLAVPLLLHMHARMLAAFPRGAMQNVAQIYDRRNASSLALEEIQVERSGVEP